jgi:hypothetical protein
VLQDNILRRYSINEIDVITENLYPLGIPLELVDSVISTIFLEGKETFGSVKVQSFET